jgi:hypothetical protein
MTLILINLYKNYHIYEEVSGFVGWVERSETQHYPNLKKFCVNRKVDLGAFP